MSTVSVTTTPSKLNHPIKTRGYKPPYSSFRSPNWGIHSADLGARPAGKPEQTNPRRLLNKLVDLTRDLNAWINIQITVRNTLEFPLWLETYSLAIPSSSRRTLLISSAASVTRAVILALCYMRGRTTSAAYDALWRQWIGGLRQYTIGNWHYGQGQREDQNRKCAEVRNENETGLKAMIHCIVWTETLSMRLQHFQWYLQYDTEQSETPWYASRTAAPLLILPLPATSCRQASIWDSSSGSGTLMAWRIL